MKLTTKNGINEAKRAKLKEQS